MPLGRLGFGQVLGDVSFGEKDLALEIVGLDEITIHDPHPADTRADQRAGCHGAQGSAAHDHRRPGAQPALSFGPDALKEDLPGIAVEFFHVYLPRTERLTRSLTLQSSATASAAATAAPSCNGDDQYDHDEHDDRYVDPGTYVVAPSARPVYTLVGILARPPTGSRAQPPAGHGPARSVRTMRTGLSKGISRRRPAVSPLSSFRRTRAEPPT